MPLSNFLPELSGTSIEVTLGTLEPSITCGLCKAAFRERVKELTPDDWEAECAYTPVNKQKEREEAQAAAAQVIAKPRLPADSD